MWRRRKDRKDRTEQPDPANPQAHARIAIATSLSGGDSTVAWNAVWDLVHSTDESAKDDVLAMLRDYVNAAVTSRSASLEPARYFGDGMTNAVDDRVDHQWNKIELACDFEEAILASKQARPRKTAPSREVRRMHQRAQQAAHDKAMRDMGVRPGEGLPMWALYMTRRSKRSWG